jgi:hypothetical protein
VTVQDRKLSEHDRQLIADHLDAESLALRKLVNSHSCKVVNLRCSIPNKVIPSLLMVALLVDDADFRELRPKPLKTLND